MNPFPFTHLISPMAPKKTRPPRTHELHGTMLAPHEMFERPLSDCFVLDGDRPFEERVERAWRHIRTTRFAPEEHERLREVLMGMITKEVDDEQRR